MNESNFKEILEYFKIKEEYDNTENCLIKSTKANKVVFEYENEMENTNLNSNSCNPIKRDSTQSLRVKSNIFSKENTHSRVLTEIITDNKDYLLLNSLLELTTSVNINKELISSRGGSAKKDDEEKDLISLIERVLQNIDESLYFKLETINRKPEKNERKQFNDNLKDSLKELLQEDEYTNIKRNSKISTTKNEAKKLLKNNYAFYKEIKIKENLTFYNKSKCTECFKVIELQKISSEFNKMSKDILWAECPH